VLALEWLRSDFQRQTVARANGAYRLLILDGHVSHLSYEFCKYAEDHKIVILCLPPHTTHALQPCDVAVFGPLASAWRKEVSTMSRRHESIRKDNFISVYDKARARAILEGTIRGGFAKTGIYPRNMSVIPAAVFEPSKITTIASAQPLPATLSALLRPLTPLVPDSLSGSPPSSSAGPSDSSLDPGPSMVLAPAPVPKFAKGLVGLPPPISGWKSREKLMERELQLDAVAKQAQAQIKADHAQKILMEGENARLRVALFQKAGKRQKREVTGLARHMTADENMVLLARADFKAKMAPIFEQLVPKFRALKAAYKAGLKAVADEAKKAEADAKKKVADDERRVKAAEKEQEKELERARKAEEKRLKDELEEVEKQVKAAEREAVRVFREKEKVDKAAAQVVAKEEKARVKEAKVAAKKAAKDAKVAAKGKTHSKKGKGKRQRSSSVSIVDDESDLPSPSPKRSRTASGSVDIADEGVGELRVATRRRPCPRPIGRAAEQLLAARSTQIAVEDIAMEVDTHAELAADDDGASGSEYEG
jgi:hypothetical protein